MRKQKYSNAPNGCAHFTFAPIPRTDYQVAAIDFSCFVKKKILYKLFSIVKLMSPFKVCHKDVKESFAIFFSIIFAMSKQKKGIKNT